jgi:hypothetical protein
MSSWIYDVESWNLFYFCELLPLKSASFDQKFRNRKSISEQWSPQNPMLYLGFIPVLRDFTHLCSCLFFSSLSVFCLMTVSDAKIVKRRWWMNEYGETGGEIQAGEN